MCTVAVDTQHMTPAWVSLRYLRSVLPKLLNSWIPLGFEKYPRSRKYKCPDERSQILKTYVRGDFRWLRMHTSSLYLVVFCSNLARHIDCHGEGLSS
jgi:hypothetical protein